MEAVDQVRRTPLGRRGLALPGAPDAAVGLRVVAVAVAPGVVLRGSRLRLRGRELCVLVAVGPDRAGNQGLVRRRLRPACRQRRRPLRAGRAHAVHRGDAAPGRGRHRRGGGGVHGLDQPATRDHGGTAAAGAAGDPRRDAGQPQPGGGGLPGRRRPCSARRGRDGGLCQRSAARAGRPRHPMAAQYDHSAAPPRGRPATGVARRPGLHPHDPRRPLEGGRGRGRGEHGVRLPRAAVRAAGGRGQPPTVTGRVRLHRRRAAGAAAVHAWRQVILQGN